MLRKKLQNKKDEKTFDEEVDEVCGRISELLKRKNASYGNAALDPIRIFSSANPEEQIRVRIDDKLSRIKRGNNSFNEDTVLDLLGYLVLLLISKNNP